MKKFFKDVLSDNDGRGSSKRVVMFIFTFLFVGVTINNVITGKDFDSTLKNQLFYLLCYLFAIVFGEKVVDAFKKDDPTPPNPPVQ